MSLWERDVNRRQSQAASERECGDSLGPRDEGVRDTEGGEKMTLQAGRKCMLVCGGVGMGGGGSV